MMMNDDGIMHGMRGCSIGVLLGIKKETMGLFKMPSSRFIMIMMCILLMTIIRNR